MSDPGWPRLFEVDGDADEVERFSDMLVDLGAQVEEISRFGTTVELLVTGDADHFEPFRRPDRPRVSVKFGVVMPEHLFRMMHGDIGLPALDDDEDEWRQRVLAVAVREAERLGAVDIMPIAYEHLDDHHRQATSDDGLPVGAIGISILLPLRIDGTGIVSVDDSGALRVRNRTMPRDDAFGGE